jgi:hypothetical protein
MKKSEAPEKKSKFKRKAAAAAAGVTAACSIALASVAPNANNLFNGVTQPETEAISTTVAKRSTTSSASAQPSRGDRLRARLRGLFLAEPSFLRGVILLPFWAAGKALLLLLNTLFAALSPVWQVLLGVLFNALLLFGLFALVYKLLFPNKRLRDLLTKRNIILLAVGSLLLAAADAILRAFWEDYRPISIAVKLVAALIVLSLLAWRIFGKRRPRPVPAA